MNRGVLGGGLEGGEAAGVEAEAAYKLLSNLGGAIYRRCQPRVSSLCDPPTPSSGILVRASA